MTGEYSQPMIPSRSLEADGLLAAPSKGRCRTIVFSPVKIDRDEIGTAVGGGPARALAEALTDSGIPAWTAALGHLLARNLELTVDGPAHSIHLALRRNARKIDVGVVEIHREDGSPDTNGFLAMAGVRADTWMVEKTNEDPKKRVGWLACIDAIARPISDRSQPRLRYGLDGRGSHRITAQTLIIGNRGQDLDHARRSFCSGCCRSPGLKPRPRESRDDV